MSMKSDIEFNSYFVGVVRKYEDLYNYNLGGYSNRVNQDRAWASVAQEVGSTAAECKTRWRMLRVSLLRHLRENKKPTGFSGKKKKPYYLENAMRFVIPFTKPRVHSGINLSSHCLVAEDEFQSRSSESNAYYDDEEVDPLECKQEYSPVEEGKTRDVDVEEERPSSPAASRRAAAPVSSSYAPADVQERPSESDRFWKIESAQVLNDSCGSCRRSRAEVDVEDADSLFLRSLLPDMKKFDDRQKRRYKQRLLMLFDEIVDEEVYPARASSESGRVSSNTRFNPALQ